MKIDNYIHNRDFSLTTYIRPEDNLRLPSHLIFQLVLDIFLGLSLELFIESYMLSFKVNL